MLTEVAVGEDQVGLLASWLHWVPLDVPVLADGVVTGTFEQSVRHDGVDRPELPSSQAAGETTWYRQLKVPVVACRFTVREATTLHVPDDFGLVGDVRWEAPGRRLVFDNGIAIGCERPNLEIHASDRVVGWLRVRLGRILEFEASAPWPGD